MKIVLTNDDGVNAPGIEALAKAAEGLGELVIVAPDTERTGCSHQVTTHSEIAVREIGCRRFAVSGTPADCTRLALFDLVPDASLVVAGINRGANIGVDVYLSGTVAAAREAVILGVPAIAVSQYHRKNLRIEWAQTANWAARVLRELVSFMNDPAEPGGKAAKPCFFNVNLPHLEDCVPIPETVFCPLDNSPLAVTFDVSDDPEESSTPTPGSLRRQYFFNAAYEQRPRVPGGDVDVCLGGRIAITELSL